MLRRSHATASASAPSCSLATPTNMQPPKGDGISRREPKRLVDMGLGFLAAAEKIFGETDASMRVGQISIQRQRLFAFSNALGRAIGKDLDEAQQHMGPRVVRAPWTKPWSRPLSAAASCCGPVVGEKEARTRRINLRQADHAPRYCRDRAPRPVRKSRALAPCIRGSSLVHASPCPGNTGPSRRDAAERSARRASASMSWASSVLASLDTISSCISKRSATGLSNRSAQR